MLLSAGFEGALGQHVLGGLMLLVTVISGLGRFSVDGAFLMTGSGARRPV